MTQESWRSGSDVPAAPILELLRRSTAADGVAALSGHVLDALGRGAVTVALNRSADVISGVAVALAADPAEVVVDPQHRRQGIGAGLVRAAIDRQGAVWAYGNLPAAAATAASLGLVPVRELLQMRAEFPADGAIALPGAESATVPDGVRIRTFVPGQDEDSFLGVNGRAFAWHPEQGRLDLAGLQSEMEQDWFDPAGFFLAVSGTGPAERVLGFHWTKVHQPDSGAPDAEPIGEIYVLGVDPLSEIRGLGGPLTGVGLEHLRQQGLRTVMLYVEGDNDRAVRLYERFGFRTSVSNVVYARSAAGTP